MLIEYRYRGQDSCKSFSKCNSVDEIVDWLKRFQNETLEDYVCYDEIEEIRLTLRETPIVFWIQLSREFSKNFNIIIILNDSPIGQIYNVDDLLLLLREIL